MKVNIHRIIKVVSCFCVIAVVLLATVTMPVLAADHIYQLSDMLSSVDNVDGEIISTYDLNLLKVTPWWRPVLNGTNQGNTSSFVFSDELPTGVPDFTYSLSCYPLGGPSENVDYGLYAVSLQDIEGSSIVSFSYFASVDGSALNLQGQWQFRGFLSLYFYDGDYNLIDSFASQKTIFDSTSSASQFRFDFKAVVAIPEGTCYVAPRINYDLVSGTALEGSTFTCEYLGSKFYISVGSVLPDSSTMERIEDAIRDLNQSVENGNQMVEDKLDDIINGDPSWNNQAQDDRDEHEELDQDLNDAMDGFDSKSDLDNLLPEEADDPLGIGAIIERWKLGDGWDALLEVITPILSHGYFPEILLMVVACINISVLLMGR